MPMEYSLCDGGAAGNRARLEGQAAQVRHSCARVGVMQLLLPFSTDTISFLGATSHYHGIYVWFHWRNLISYWLIKNHENANTLRSTAGGRNSDNFLFLFTRNQSAGNSALFLLQTWTFFTGLWLYFYPEKHVFHTHISDGKCCITVVGGRRWLWGMNCKLWRWIWWKDSGLQ